MVCKSIQSGSYLYKLFLCELKSVSFHSNVCFTLATLVSCVSFVYVLKYAQSRIGQHSVDFVSHTFHKPHCEPLVVLTHQQRKQDVKSRCRVCLSKSKRRRDLVIVILSSHQKHCTWLMLLTLWGRYPRYIGINWQNQKVRTSVGSLLHLVKLLDFSKAPQQLCWFNERDSIHQNCCSAVRLSLIWAVTY